MGLDYAFNITLAHHIQLSEKFITHLFQLDMGKNSLDLKFEKKGSLIFNINLTKRCALVLVVYGNLYNTCPLDLIRTF